MNNEDMSDIFKKLNNIADQNNISPDMVNNLFNMLNNNSSDSNSSNNANNNAEHFNNQNNSSNNSGIDFETIMKMKNIMDKMNIQNDPRSNLLQSLKPYLNDSRRSKVDQYIKLMNMSKVMDIFPFIGGENKK